MLDLTPYLLRWYVQIYSRIIISKSHENTLVIYIHHTYFSQEVNNPKCPLETFDPTYVDVSCETLLKDHGVQLPW